MNGINYYTTIMRQKFYKKYTFNKVNLKIRKYLEYQLEQKDVDYLNSITTEFDDRLNKIVKGLKNQAITKIFSNFNL